MTDEQSRKVARSVGHYPDGGRDRVVLRADKEGLEVLWDTVRPSLAPGHLGRAKFLWEELEPLKEYLDAGPE